MCAPGLKKEIHVLQENYYARFNKASHQGRKASITNLFPEVSYFFCFFFRLEYHVHLFMLHFIVGPPYVHGQSNSKLSLKCQLLAKI